MHRATDARLYPVPPCLSITTVNMCNQRCPPAMAHFATATFGAPEGGPYCGPTSRPYPGLCGPTRLQAVMSSILQRPPAPVRGQPVSKFPVTGYSKTDARPPGGGCDWTSCRSIPSAPTRTKRRRAHCPERNRARRLRLCARNSNRSFPSRGAMRGSPPSWSPRSSHSHRF